jgi:hypothetical protein
MHKMLRRQNYTSILCKEDKMRTRLHLLKQRQFQLDKACMNYRCHMFLLRMPYTLQTH